MVAQLQTADLTRQTNPVGMAGPKLLCLRSLPHIRRIIMRRITVIFTSIVFLFAGMPASFADVVSSAEILQAEQTQYDRQQVLAYVDSEAVQAEMLAQGVDIADARDRIANMTDAEISALNAHMQDLPAAGSVNALVTVLVVFLVLDLLGITDVFSFIYPII
jgi:hypothetical protein